MTQHAQGKAYHLSTAKPTIFIPATELHFRLRYCRRPALYSELAAKSTSTKKRSRSSARLNNDKRRKKKKQDTRAKKKLSLLHKESIQVTPNESNLLENDKKKQAKEDKKFRKQMKRANPNQLKPAKKGERWVDYSILDNALLLFEMKHVYDLYVKPTRLKVSETLGIIVEKQSCKDYFAGGWGRKTELPNH